MSSVEFTEQIAFDSLRDKAEQAAERSEQGGGA